MWNRYINGNHKVCIDSETGTKIRILKNSNEQFISDFADSIDFKITNKCQNGCPMCHELSVKNGKHGDMNRWNFLNTLHPYQEVAIGGGNPLEFPDLIPLLIKLKSLNVFANITINQKDLNNNLLDRIVSDGLIYGVGISFFEYKPNDLKKIRNIKNSVLHLINGLTANENMINALSYQGYKILILGYKNFGRGKVFYNKNSNFINPEIEWMKKNILSYRNGGFDSISFDNLAVKQLDIKSQLSDKEWNAFWGGDDGSHTFYIDGVNMKFAKSSTSLIRYDLLDNVDDMFKVIKNS